MSDSPTSEHSDIPLIVNVDWRNETQEILFSFSDDNTNTPLVFKKRSSLRGTDFGLKLKGVNMVEEELSLLTLFDNEGALLFFNDKEYQIKVDLFPPFIPVPESSYGLQLTPGITDTPYWSYYLKPALLKLGLKVAEVQSTKLERHEKDYNRGILREVKTVHEDGSTGEWFIKVYFLEIDWLREKKVNEVLDAWQCNRMDMGKYHDNTVLLTAKLGFEGFLDESAKPTWFLVFPYIEHVTLYDIWKNDSLNIQTREVLEGFVRILAVYFELHPSSSLLPNMQRIHFCHKDLTPNQIIYSLKYKKIFLVDFGLSQIEFLGEFGIQHTIYLQDKEKEKERYKREIANIVRMFDDAFEGNPHHKTDEFFRICSEKVDSMRWSNFDINNLKALEELLENAPPEIPQETRYK
eukprot:TRINITY_DN5870_c0_g2_i14.p1 TRINITY_DN5870_c0_g2~~TRINITY_DN5870_c0_g2_i14.p1  ORF type:complete len:407 (+),score=81.51 TRINITY_DN5870_c0_g2_i14:236-1456(+)